MKKSGKEIVKYKVNSAFPEVPVFLAMGSALIGDRKVPEDSRCLHNSSLEDAKEKLAWRRLTVNLCILPATWQQCGCLSKPVQQRTVLL